MVKKLWSREEDGQLPNWLNEEQKSRCYCDDRGWVLVHKDGNEEVIVAANTLNDPAEKGHGFDPVTGNSLDPDRAGAHNDISYSLSKSTEMVNEGDFVKITLETTGVPDNTLVPYTVEGVESEDLTAGQISGSFSITGGKGTVDLTAVRDSLTEGTQTLVLKLPTGESISVDVGDTSRTPSYNLSAPASINENSSFDITLNASHAPANTQIGYTLSGSVDLANDFNEVMSQTGFFTVGSDTQENSSDSLTFNVKDDKTWAEGDETLILTLDGGLGTITVNIVDSSIADPVYELVAPQSSNENSSFDITLNATNVPSNTQIGYTLSGSVDLSNDFDEVMSQTGFFTVGSDTLANSSDSLTFNVKDDKTWSEGDETLILTLDGGLGTVQVNITDSSIAGSVYELQALPSVNEGEALTITLNANNVPANTQIGYTLSGSVNLNTDFDEVVPSSGSFTVGSDTQENSSDSLTLNVKDDKTWAEGDETLTLTLDGGLGTITVNIVDSSIADPVYELVAPTSSNEGESFDITLNATNVPANTQIGYTLSGSVNLNTDFNEVMSQTGFFTVGSDTLANSSDSLTFNVRNDSSFEEGDKELTLTLDGGLGTVTIPIIDSSRAIPTFGLSSNPLNQASEGGPLTISLTYQNVSVGTEIGYNLTGSTVNLNTDFDPPVSNTGKFIIGEQEEVTFNIVADESFEEGNEVLKLTLDNGKASIQVPIIDTSTATPSYNLSTSGDVTFVNENDSVTISLGYQNLSVGTEVPYTISGDVDLNDFTPPLESYNGKFVIGDPLTEKVDLFLADDKTFDEGDEILTLTLDGVNEAKSIVVKDTSRQTEVYGLSAPASTNENASFSISLNTQFVTAGTEVPYTLSGNYEPEDFNPPLTSSTGTFIVGEDETLTLSVADDKTWAENNESLTLTLDGKGISVEVDIVDSSIADPVYELVASPANVNEGEALTITLNATNVPANTTIGYSIDAVGGGISLTDDFDSVVSSTGSFTVGSDTLVNSSDSITFNLKEDKLTETAAESLILTLDGGLGSVTVPIADTSKTEIFTLESSAVNDTIGEGGDPLVITLTTQNVPDGTYGYTIQGINDDDLNLANSDQLHGNFVLVGGTDTITLDIKADAVTEIPNDVIDLSLNNGKASIQITVEDTSKTPVYDLSSNPQISVNEGVSLRIELQTTNVSESLIPYSVEGIQAADLDSGSALLTGGSFTLDSNGYGFIDFLIKADKVTDGDKTLTLTLDGGLGTISVNVLDTSKEPIWELTTSPVGNVNEGVDLLITLQTQNVDAGNYTYNITGTSGFDSTDLDSGSSPLSGSFAVTGDSYSETLTLKIKKDYTSGEGDETITISLPDVAEVADVNVVINDSSSVDPTDGGEVPGVSGIYWYPEISKDGQYLAMSSGAASGTKIYTFNSSNSTWDFLQTVTPTNTAGWGRSFSEDGSRLVLVGYSNKSIPIYQRNANGTYDLETTLTFSGGSTSLWGAAFSGDGNLLTVCPIGGTEIETFEYDGSSWSSVDIFTPGYSYANLDMSSDGQMLVAAVASTGSNNGAHIYERNGNGWSYVTYVWSGISSQNRAVALSNDKKLIAYGTSSFNSNRSVISFFDYDESSQTWVMRSGQIETTDGIGAHTNEANKITMSEPDSDGTITLITTRGKIYYIPATLSTYSISGPSSVDEGQDLTLTLNTLGINGDIAYTISGINDADLDIAGGSHPTTGVFQVANETGSITLKLLEDADSAPGSLTITVDQGGENEASKTVTINDITESYILTATNTIDGAINEGEPLTINLSTINVSGPVPYEVTGNYEPEDFDTGSDPFTGEFTLDQDGNSSVTFNIKADETTDGPESLTLTLTGTSNQISITINDTSIEPSSQVGVLLHQGGVPAISGDSTVISTNVWDEAKDDYNTLSRGEVRIFNRNPVDNTITERYTIPRPYGATPLDTNTTEFGRENVSFNNDGSLAAISATGDGNGKVYIYEWDDVNELYDIRDEILAPESNKFGYCSLSGDGNTLVVGSSGNNKVYTYEYNTGTSQWDRNTSTEFTLPVDLSSVSISNTKNSLVVGSKSTNSVYTYDWNESNSSWDLRNGGLLNLQSEGYGDYDWANTLSLTNDGNTMVISSPNGIPTWHLWDWNSTNSQWEIRFVGEDDTSGSYGPLGHAVGASGVNNGVITLVVTWKRNANSEVRVIIIPQNP